MRKIIINVNNERDIFAVSKESIMERVMENARKISITAAVLASIIAVAGVAIVSIDSVTHEKPNSTVAHNGKTFSISFADKNTTHKSVKPTIVHKKSPAAATKLHIAKTTHVATQTHKKYAVQVATFKNKSYAEKMKLELSKNYSSVAILSSKGKHRVVILTDNKSKAKSISKKNKGSFVSKIS